jgi:long-chain fatty acid transport protein
MANYQKLGFAIALCTSASTAFATNGYAPHGIGMTSKGMGGVTIGYQGDSVAVGGNPAGSAFMEDRMDVGLDLFRPIRSSTIDFGPGGSYNYDGSETKLFPIPEFGYRRGINDKMAFAVSVFGNGGMNTDYDPGIPLFNGSLGMAANAPAFGPNTGINLMQLFVVPSVSYKVNSNNAIGIGLNLVAQGFEAEGLTGFTNFSTNPSKLTDNGMDWSYGAGVRIGWVGKVTDQLTFGLTYQSRTYMTDLSDYKGLFADEGAFDIPSNYGIGVAYQATPKLLIAADIQQINYSDIDAIGNSVNNFGNCSAFAMMAPNSYCLGGSNGPGFGWDDMTVYKIGAQFEVSPELTLRAGWNYGKAPIPSNDETLFNVLAPATVENHLTLGATWKVDPTVSVTATYMHAFENEIKDTLPGPLGAFPAASIEMYQDSFGVAVSWKL